MNEKGLLLGIISGWKYLTKVIPGKWVEGHHVSKLVLYQLDGRQHESVRYPKCRETPLLSPPKKSSYAAWY